MVCIVICAAGKGTRMNDNNIPKVLRKVEEKTMLEMVLETAIELIAQLTIQSLDSLDSLDSLNINNEIIVIVSNENKEAIERTIETINSNQTNIKTIQNIKIAVQEKVNGTASAVLTAKQFYENEDLLVLLGDVPLIKYSTLKNIIEGKENGILGFVDDEKNKFGRLFVKDGCVEKIVEYNEATIEERKIKTMNSGILFLNRHSTQYLDKITNNNSKKEYYLTDIVKILNDANIKVKYYEASHKECYGANSPEELERLNKFNQEN